MGSYSRSELRQFWGELIQRETWCWLSGGSNQRRSLGNLFKDRVGAGSRGAQTRGCHLSNYITDPRLSPSTYLPSMYDACHVVHKATPSPPPLAFPTSACHTPSAPAATFHAACRGSLSRAPHTLVGRPPIAVLPLIPSLPHSSLFHYLF